MSKTLNAKPSLALDDDFYNLGIRAGDTILLRAGLQSVGRISRQEFLATLLRAVGPDGTIASLSFTGAAFLWKSNGLDPFTQQSPSYAGALPNTMLAHPEAHRSSHPQCSFVAIGRNAKVLVDNHGPSSPAYEPIRRLIQLGGKVALVGCVSSSPGFTTAHLAEYDLGLHRRAVLPSFLMATPYIDEQGSRQFFRRSDPGLCSNSFWKFYAHYVRAGVLSAGFVGAAYSIMADAKACYEIEKTLLDSNPRFNVCDDPLCATCNLLRWDRLHKGPGLLARMLYRKLIARASWR